MEQDTTLREILVGVALCVITAASAAGTAGGQAAWFWRTACGDKALSIDVTLANKPVYHSEVPICHMVRSQGAVAKEGDSLTFSLKTTQAIVFSGYRATNEFVPAGRLLEMSVWQAGADPDTLALGISVADTKEIYVNTVLFAKPDGQTSEELGTGLVITMKPVKRRGS